MILPFLIYHLNEDNANQDVNTFAMDDDNYDGINSEGTGGIESYGDETINNKGELPINYTLQQGPRHRNLEIKELVDNPYYNDIDNIDAMKKSDPRTFNVNDTIENITILQTTLNPYYCPLEKDASQK